MKSPIFVWYPVPFTMFPFSNVAQSLLPFSASNVQVLLPLCSSPLTMSTVSWTLPEKSIYFPLVCCYTHFFSNKTSWFQRKKGLARKKRRFEVILNTDEYCITHYKLDEIDTDLDTLFLYKILQFCTKLWLKYYCDNNQEKYLQFECTGLHWEWCS